MGGLVDALIRGQFAGRNKDCLRDIATGKDVEASIEALGIERVDSGEASTIIAKLVKEREHFGQKEEDGRDQCAHGPRDGRARGKVDSKTINELLKKEIEKLLSS